MCRRRCSISSGRNSRVSNRPRSDALGVGFAVGLLVALWSANSGMKALFDALNVAYDETEKRGFFKLLLGSLGFTLGGLVFFILVLNVVIGVPIVLKLLPLGSMGNLLVAVVPPIVLFAVAIFVIVVLYRYGPSRTQPQWRGDCDRTRALRAQRHVEVLAHPRADGPLRQARHAGLVREGFRMTQDIRDLERDIEQTRARLDLTIDRLQDKLSMSGIVDDVLGTMRGNRYGSIYDHALDVIKRNPVPVMLVAAGVAHLPHGGERPLGWTHPDERTLRRSS
jgi:hypothetical protein